jgi:hypothetical protein
MKVIATCLAPGVSITLTDDGSGWQFVSWSSQSRMGADRFPDPPPVALQQRFSTERAALEYFRGLCRHDAVAHG